MPAMSVGYTSVEGSLGLYNILDCFQDGDNNKDDGYDDDGGGSGGINDDK